MTYTWGQARTEIRRVLNDDPVAEEDRKYTDEILQDGMNRALKALSSHTAVASSDEFAGDGETMTVSLPDNCLDDLPYVFLWDEVAQVWWKPIAVTPGFTAPDPTPVSGSQDYRFYEWPNLTLNLLSAPAGDVVIYYFAYWDDVSNDDEDAPISIPMWAREACVMYTVSYAVSSTIVSTADIRRWDTKNDSGQPEHNPLLRVRDSFMKAYEDILRRHPVQEKIPPFDGWRT